MTPELLQLEAPTRDVQCGLSPAPCSAGASAINDVEEWRIACNWKATDPEWDATLKTVIAFAREGQRLAAQPNIPS